MICCFKFNRRSWLVLSLMFACLCLQAQNDVHFRFLDATGLTVAGQAQSVDKATYARVSAETLPSLPRRVAELAGQSAGLNIMFETDSKNIQVKWVLHSFNQLWNMTPVAVNGLDLYAYNGKNWQFVASARPVGDTNVATVVNNLDGKMRQYKLYLPLYARVEKLLIGVDSNSVARGVSGGAIPGKKVVIYGSSITQGASASRPGMAYPSIISRHLGVETFNMGFSGSGKMEVALADVIGNMAADVYILDCVPNPSPKEIHERTIPFVQRLRKLKPETPIILVESIFREDGNWNLKKGEIVANQNKEFRQAYDQLLEQGVRKLYYIPSNKLIGDDHEATVDGTHLTDLGFTRIAHCIEEVLRKVL